MEQEEKELLTFSPDKYEHMLTEKGWPHTVVENAVSIIRQFFRDYKGDFSDENIRRMDYEMAERYPGSNPALMLVIYRDYFGNGIEPEVYNRRRGVKDGYSRPVNCPNSDCEHNAGRRCRYDPARKLDYLLTWRKCKVYKRNVEEDEQPKERKKEELYDEIFSRRAIYKDSHSAMWME